MEEMRPEVFVVDDDASVRTAAATLLRSVGHAVRTFASAREFLDGGGHLRPGCLVLDLRLPDEDGMAVYDEIRARGGQMPVVFMTAFGDIRTSVRAMKSGAADFLPKPVAGDVLLRAVADALARDARRRADRAQADDLARRRASLTPREREVMALLLEGCTSAEIGAALGIAAKTAKVHRARVMVKMGVRRVAQLAALAERWIVQGGETAR
jgi:FixJ family two-component response regulator